MPDPASEAEADLAAAARAKGDGALIVGDWRRCVVVTVPGATEVQAACTSDLLLMVGDEERDACSDMPLGAAHLSAAVTCVSLTLCAAKRRDDAGVVRHDDEEDEEDATEALGGGSDLSEVYSTDAAGPGGEVLASEGDVDLTCGGEHDLALLLCAHDDEESGSSNRCTVSWCDGGLEPLGSMRESTSRREPATNHQCEPGTSQYLSKLYVACACQVRYMLAAQCEQSPNIMFTAQCDQLENIELTKWIARFKMLVLFA